MSPSQSGILLYGSTWDSHRLVTLECADASSTKCVCVSAYFFILWHIRHGTVLFLTLTELLMLPSSLLYASTSNTWELLLSLSRALRPLVINPVCLSMLNRLLLFPADSFTQTAEEWDKGRHWMFSKQTNKQKLSKKITHWLNCVTTQLLLFFLLTK